MNKPKVLIACEESQRVCTAMRDIGIEAYSCDILPCSGGHPEWHIHGDVQAVLQGECYFQTMDGFLHKVDGEWDMIIAHPPCTYLTGAGAANIPKHPERIELGFNAAGFFMSFLNARCERICVENPPPMKRFMLPKYTQLTRPWMFGDNNNKPIALWLKGLPLLKRQNPCDYIPDMIVWTYKATGEKKSCSRWYNTDTAHHGFHRSKTFPGIAKAMADQWGRLLLKEEEA